MKIRLLIQLVAVAVPMFSSFIHLSYAIPNCALHLTSSAQYSKFTPALEGLTRRIRSESRAITVYLAVDLFLPVPNRGQSPSFVVTLQTLSKLYGVFIENEPIVPNPTTHGGFTFIKVQATRAGLVELAQLPQVVRISITNNPIILEGLARNRDLTKDQIKNRLELEKKLTDKYKRAEQIEEINRQLENLRQELSEVNEAIRENESGLAEVAFKLSMTSAQSTNVTSRVRYMEEQESFKRVIERLFDKQAYLIEMISNFESQLGELRSI